MASRLGADYAIEIETISKPRPEYRTPEWEDTELPCAPAIMVGEEVVVEGSDIHEDVLVSEIRKQLGPPPREHA